MAEGRFDGKVKPPAPTSFCALYVKLTLFSDYSYKAPQTGKEDLFRSIFDLCVDYKWLEISKIHLYRIFTTCGPHAVKMR